MSTKMGHALNHWFNLLAFVQQQHGGSATAGQVAKEAGTARTTARRWLDRLVENDAALCYKHVGKNTLPVFRYNTDR